MRRTRGQAIPSLLSFLTLAGAATAWAGQVTYDFNTDPTAVLDIVTSVNDQPWQESGGNPGGFLAVSYPEDSQFAAFAFPDIDEGKIVTAFRFEADLRVGNPEGDRGADGFSVSFARSNDPLLADGGLTSANFAGGIPEGGSTTGIAVAFDTWAGNTLPDGADIEGIIVRVDNRTVLRQALPTRNGACDDATSLQTGPRDAEFWTAQGDRRSPESWDTLCWQKLIVDLDAQSKLTVSWKGRAILEAFQTTYFPTAGRIILAGRTGGENEHTHFDNVKLTTTATAADTEKPSAPGNPVVTAGARRVALTWGAATDNSGRVAYKVVRDGTTLANLLTDTQYVDLNVTPGKTYAYQVIATDVSNNESTPATASATTGAEIDVPGWLVAEIYDGIQGTAVQALLDDPKYPASPDRTRYVNGISFGFGGASGPEFGDNLGVRIAGVLSPLESGQYRFFVRSDDASQFYLNTTGAALPVPGTDAPIAEETDCCDAFQEPDVANDDGATFPTSAPVQLTAGQRYGFVFLVKEGGGGDNGEVAWRKEGDTTAAGSLGPIRGVVLPAGKGDPAGSSITFVTQPANTTTVAYFPTTLTASVTSSNVYTTNLVYQWYRNNTAIPGATAATYTIPVTQPTDNGATFKVTAVNPGAVATSQEATLTVSPNQAPKVATVTGSDAFTNITLRFDQPVTPATAGTAANYTLGNGATVSSATVVDQFTVRLGTSQQTPGTNYNITITGVQNLGGTAVAANTVVPFQAWDLVPNRARADQFTGLNGAGLADLEAAVADPKYPNSPDVVRYTAGLTFGEPAFGDTWGENHLVAMKAILRPTQSGNYRFFVRSDDASRLYINTTGAAIPDITTATWVAQEANCCNAFEEPGAGNNGDDTFPTSQPISLTAGQSYGVLYLVKEGGGGDWGQVAWRREGDTTAAANLAPITAESYWYGPAATSGLKIDSIATQGGNVTITYSAGTLEASDTVNGTYAPVAGATSPYTTQASGSQRFFRLRQ